MPARQDKQFCMFLIAVANNIKYWKDRHGHRQTTHPFSPGEASLGIHGESCATGRLFCEVRWPRAWSGPKIHGTALPSCLGGKAERWLLLTLQLSCGSSPPLLLKPVPRRKQESCLLKPWAHLTDKWYRWMTPQTVFYKNFHNRHLDFLLQDEVLMMKIIWGWGIQKGSPHWWHVDWCYVPQIQTNLISRPHDLDAKFKP